MHQDNKGGAQNTRLTSIVSSRRLETDEDNNPMSDPDSFHIRQYQKGHTDDGGSHLLSNEARRDSNQQEMEQIVMHGDQSSSQEDDEDQQSN